MIWGDFATREVIIHNTLTADNIAAKSDKRFKTEIRAIENTLEKVLGLRGVTYKWEMDQAKGGETDQSTQIGLIAQEVEEYFPELVIETSRGYKALNYGKMSAVLVEAIKEQQSQIEDQQKLIRDLTRRIELLEGK